MSIPASDLTGLALRDLLVEIRDELRALNTAIQQVMTHDRPPRIAPLSDAVSVLELFRLAPIGGWGIRPMRALERFVNGPGVIPIDPAWRTPTEADARRFLATPDRSLLQVQNLGPKSLSRIRALMDELVIPEHTP